MEITKAIQALRPGADWDLSGVEYSGLNWSRETIQTKPTEQEIIDWISANDYAEKRKAEYPPIDEQVAALMAGGTELADMKSKVDAVKTKYPKP